MKVLFDETFTDGERSSRNIWYGYADIMVAGEYGKSIKLTEEFMDTLCEIINKDLDKPASETNWYFYGSDVTKDAIGDTIRPTIMVRERSGEFVTNINMSDHDFAVNLDAILSFKAEFEKRLANL